MAKESTPESQHPLSLGREVPLQEAIRRVQGLEEYVRERLGEEETELLRSLRASLLDLKRRLLSLARRHPGERLAPESIRFLGDVEHFFRSGLDQLHQTGIQRVVLSQPSYELTEQSVDPIGTYRNAWAATQLFRLQPRLFVDVSSSLDFITIASRKIPCVAVDPQLVPIHMRQLQFCMAYPWRLPFCDRSVPMLTALGSLERVGLGAAYGEASHPLGPVDAVTEFLRVVQPGGYLILSFPVACQMTLYFQERWCFSVDWITNRFRQCQILESLWLDPQSGPVSCEDVRDLDRGYHYVLVVQTPSS